MYPRRPFAALGDEVSAEKKPWQPTVQAFAASVSATAAAFTALCILPVTAYVAFQNWNGEIEKRKLDATLRYLDPLLQREFIDSLWDIEEFTICFEKSQQRHLAYLPFKHVNAAERKSASLDLARQWWYAIENDVSNECGKKDDADRQLMFVYGRLDALASCLQLGLCDWSRLFGAGKSAGLMESFDYLAVLSISNYLLLSGDASREWNADEGNFKYLSLRIEEHAKEFLDLNRAKLWEGRLKKPVEPSKPPP